eukprot:scaffold81952_cov61-Phaeocystis_antarctica.AAC.6
MYCTGQYSSTEPCSRSTESAPSRSTAPFSVQYRSIAPHPRSPAPILGALHPILGPLHRPRSQTEDADHEGQRRDKEAGVEHAKAHLGVRVRVRVRVATR